MAGDARRRSVSIPGTLTELLASSAARFSDREALVSPRGRWTYRAVEARAAAVASGLAAQGVRAGTHVGLLAPNWPEWLVLAFAIWRLGGVLVPLSTLYRPRELRHALALADVEVLIAVRGFLRHDYGKSLADAGAPRTLRTTVWLAPPADGEPVDLQGIVAPGETEAAARADAPATIVFTSGSTADPKGAVHTQAALARSAVENAAVLGLTAEDRTWGYLPFFFAGGLVAVALATLSAGGAVVLQEVFEPGETLALLARERVSVFFAWPHQAEALLAHPHFATTRLVLRKGVGANAKWAAALYPPDHQATSSYGMTETPPLCCAWPFDAPRDLRTSSHGPPVGSRELRIVDPETGRAVAAGTDGEICVRGPTVMREYYKVDRAVAFDADGFFHTGDLGHLDVRGALHFVGRAKDVIKSGGANVAAAEVEAVLLRHPAVAAAHAVGVPDPQRGESVAAFVVVTTPVDAAALTAHCRAELASYKVPRFVWIRREDELPQKGSGKVDKAALRAEAGRLTAAGPRS
jgi:acyl-CoA synthetase (AMP-forming)/AMP-acid ligase II